jgi:hypothetical protein
LLPPSTAFFLNPDAGFFLDHPTVSGEPLFRSEFQGAFGENLWNATGGTDAACVATYAPQNETWKCFFAQYVFPFYGTANIDGVHVVNSMYDTAQMSLILEDRKSVV